MEHRPWLAPKFCILFCEWLTDHITPFLQYFLPRYKSPRHTENLPSSHNLRYRAQVFLFTLQYFLINFPLHKGLHCKYGEFLNIHQFLPAFWLLNLLPFLHNLLFQTYISESTWSHGPPSAAMVTNSLLLF